jgi:hypothetical protein
MKRQWTQDELAEHWTLLPDELKLLANKTGATRLCFSLLLKTFAYQGGAFRVTCTNCLVQSSPTSPNRSASLRNCIPRYEWRAARSSITVSRFGSFWASARQRSGMATNSSDGWSRRCYSGHSSRKSLEIYSHLAIADAQLAYDEVMPRFPV